MSWSCKKNELSTSFYFEGESSAKFLYFRSLNVCFTFGSGRAQASHRALSEPLTVNGRDILGTLWFSRAA